MTPTGRDDATAPGRQSRPAAVPEGIASKSEIPPRVPHRVARPRLDALLSNATEARVTLVSGYAGCGKTTAVREWVVGTGTRTAWVTLDSTDDHPVRFWNYTLAAIETAAPGASGAAIDMLSETGGLDDAFIGALLNEVGRLGEPLALVIDDLHVVHDRRVFERLAYLVDRAPERLRVVLISRSQPSLPLGRWRVRGELFELSETELSFRPEEAAAFLSTFDGLHLNDADVELLARRTEGWAVGLQLAALSMQSSDDSSAFIRHFAGGDGQVAEFLVDEVLGAQSPAIRDFVSAMSVVERFNADLGRALSGRADAVAVLRQLESDRLFVVALDSERVWFRYHQLFRELLVADLERRDPGRRRALHLVAAQWFAAAGDTRVAVGHLLRAGDTEQAFELAMAPAPIVDGRRFHQGDWIDLFSPAFVTADPERMARFALALGAGSHFADAEAWLERAEAAMERGEQQSPNFREKLVAMRSMLHAVRGDAEGAIRVGAPLLPALGDRLTEDIALERFPIHLARSYLLLDDVDAADATVEIVASHRGISEIVTFILVPALRANVAVVAGELGEAESLATHALRGAETLQLPSHYGTLDARLARGTVHVEREQLATGEAEFHELLNLAVDVDSIPYATLGELGLAWVAWARGNTADAIAHIARARETASRSSGAVLRRRVDVFDARIAVAIGDDARAATLVSRLPDGVERGLLRARVELATDLSAVKERLDSLPATRLRDRIVTALLLSRVAQEVSEKDRHRATAVELAAPAGFRRVFAEEGAPFPSSSPGEVGVASLFSGREWAVLRHLPGPMSNAEIASELFISSNTLKTHVRRVYRKLNARSRDEAVANARRMGLL
jgi:ATP/maltotriose-dependent transcriptional regulator MalT